MGRNIFYLRILCSLVGGGGEDSKRTKISCTGMTSPTTRVKCSTVLLESPFTSVSKSCASHESTFSLSSYYLKNADRLLERGLLVVLDALEALRAPLPRRKRVNLLHQLENRRHLLGIKPVHLAAETRTKILAPIFTWKNAGKENVKSCALFQATESISSSN